MLTRLLQFEGVYIVNTINTARKMRFNVKGATGAAAVAAIGNFLQGWDGGAIAGKNPFLLIYVKHGAYVMRFTTSIFHDCRCFGLCNHVEIAVHMQERFFSLSPSFI